MVGEVLEKY